MPQETSLGIPAGPRADARQPLLWAAIAFAVGILLGVYAWRPPVRWITAFACFVAIMWFWRTRRPRLAMVISAAALICAGAACVELRVPDDPGLGINTYADGREIAITAHVIKEGYPTNIGDAETREAVDVETEKIEIDNRVIPIRARVRMSFYGNRPEFANLPANTFLYGQRMRFLGKLHPPRNFRNPGAFDYESYLRDHGIAVLGSAKIAWTEPQPGFARSRFGRWRSRMHRSIVSKIHALWPPEQAALMDAMVIGEDAFIAHGTRAEFQRSGTYHLLVVSGMNLSILAFTVFWVLRRLKASEIVAAAVTVVLSVAYAVLTDVGPPIWRATLMLAVFLAARMLYRDRSMLNAIGAAALVLMVADPRVLVGASFQLTFLAVLIIAAVAVPLLDRTSQPYQRGVRYLDSVSYDISLKPKVTQFRLDLRMIAGRLEPFLGARFALTMLVGLIRSVLAIFEVLAVSAIMQLGLALPMAYYFHRATVVGFPANVVVVPVTGVLMPSAALAIATSYISPILARGPAEIASLALSIITGTVQGLGALRIADARVAMPGIVSIALSIGAVAAAMLLARRRALAAVAGLCGMIAAAILICTVPPQAKVQAGTFEITGIDVGQADSTLLISPEGKTLVVDGGGPVGGQRSDFDLGEEVVSPYLWQRGISRLDAVMITHGHSDHIGGIPALLRNFRPKELWIGPMPQTQAVKNLLQEADELHIRVLKREENEHFNFGSVEVTILAPPEGWKSGVEAHNNDSLVARFAYRDTSALLEGDAERGAEHGVALKHPRADLLKIAHNGSRTSTTTELLDTLQPKFALISVGMRNTYGHPNRDVLARLEDHHVATYRTDLNGAVTFYLDGNRIRVPEAVH